MAQDDIQFVDNSYFRIPLVKPGRKIKFKNISFKNILSRWKQFRISRLKKKLEAKKENLVEMEFSSGQLERSEHVERKILRKTQAIARLESKINFLETGKHHSKEFIGSRAIKLKSLMMNNLVYNRDSLYCVTEKAAEQIMNDNNASAIIDEEKEKIGARVREILAEKEAAKKAAAPAQSRDVATPKQTGPEKSSSVAEHAPVVSSDEVAEAIDQEMNRIKISSNESSTAKVNKFINEDGTYRLKRDDIDADFRITKISGEQPQNTASEPVDVIAEPNIPPFSTSIRKKIDVEGPKKALTTIPDREAPVFPKIVLPTIKESVKSSTAGREIPVVAPERQNADSNIRKEGMTQPVVSNDKKRSSELGALDTLMARVNVLLSERQTIKARVQEANQKASSVEEAHREMMRRLSEYADSLEEDCNKSYHEMSQVQHDAAQKEAQINAMIQLMESAPNIPENTKGRAK